MEKNLLPEKEYYAWDEEMVALREKTINVMLHFNRTGDK